MGPGNFGGYDSRMTLLNWSEIDTVLLDMDGTVLDLSFDNRFWLHAVPEKYAESRGLALAAAQAELAPQFDHWRGQLQWYCLDHWREITQLDLKAMKQAMAEHIRPLPGAIDFLQRLRAAGKQVWLVTNAHRDALDVKLAATGIAPHFDQIISSHDFGYPKESPDFWQALQQAFSFEAQRSLFVDDSESVLAAARAYGIARVLAISHPDSTAPPRALTDYESVPGLASLSAGIPGA